MRIRFYYLKAFQQHKINNVPFIYEGNSFEIIDANLFAALIDVEHSNNEKYFNRSRLTIKNKNIRLMLKIFKKMDTPYSRIMYYGNNADLVERSLKRAFSDRIYEDKYFADQKHPKIYRFLFDKKGLSTYVDGKCLFRDILNSGEATIEIGDGYASLYLLNWRHPLDCVLIYHFNDQDFEIIIDNKVSIHEFHIAHILFMIKKSNENIYEVLLNNLNSGFVKSLKSIESKDLHKIIKLIENVNPKMYLELTYKEILFIYEK